MIGCGFGAATRMLIDNAILFNLNRLPCTFYPDFAIYQTRSMYPHGMTDIGQALEDLGQATQFNVQCAQWHCLQTGQTLITPNHLAKA